jgi:DNA (cytosine-5)-methyltransferase 1
LIAAIQERAVCENAAAGPDGVGVRTDGAAYTMEARTVPQAVVFGTEGVAPTIPSRRSAGGGLGTDFDCDGAKAGNNAGMVNPVINSLGVRRLTPTECEALQGFPRGYTDIIYRGKRAMDGPRYKSLGNSMATNVMSWIGQRIKIASATSPSRRRGFVPPSENL